jgi:hypothetical protein
VSTLEDLNAGPGGMAGFVSALSRRLRPVSRRDVLVGATVAATALATKPKEYALTPVAAYATICGPGNTAASGWTVFCSTVNKGVNSCPPGSFAAGWWKAADSSWCGGGYRYIVDCNASCSKCTTGCSDNLCDSRCWSCSCGTGSKATCDQRRICCNAFRYGQCNTHVKCSGGVHCRVVSCVPPYKFASCTTTSLSDNRTSEHSAPSLPVWSALTAKYKAIGDLGSFLKASTGPQTAVGDGRGQYINFQGGVIYWSSATGARALPTAVRNAWGSVGGPKGLLGYPTQDLRRGLPDSGWIQIFEKGAITDSASTSTRIVYGTAYTAWTSVGRESGELRYPTANRVSGLRNGGWRQPFQGGVVTQSAATPVLPVAGASYTAWVAVGRETGLLGYPTTGRTTGRPNGGWIQLFETGAVTDSASTTTRIVYGAAYTAWVSVGRESGALRYPTQNRVSGLPGGGWRQQFQSGVVTGSASTAVLAVAGDFYTAYNAAGRESGVLGYPTSALSQDSTGRNQTFQGGELWALGSSGPARRVYGGVLSAWRAEGGAAGRYGYPLTDTVPSGGGLTCTFQGGTITT